MVTPRVNPSLTFHFIILGHYPGVAMPMGRCSGPSRLCLSICQVVACDFLCPEADPEPQANTIMAQNVDRPRIQRRRGACEACKAKKTKCTSLCLDYIQPRAPCLLSTHVALTLCVLLDY
jgi:hypothetical protein